MAKRKGKQAALRKTKWEEFLLLPQTLATLASITEGDFGAPSVEIIGLLKLASEILEKEIGTPAEFLDEVRLSNVYSSQPSGSPASDAFVVIRRFDNTWKDYSQCNPTHWQKRWHVHELGLDLPRYSVSGMITHRFDRNKSQNTCPFDIKPIECYPQEGLYQRYHYLYDTKTSVKKSYTVNPLCGFYAVPSNESAIFYSYNAKRDMQIELVVIRNVAASSSISDGLFKWLTEVVTEACDERRNVRPDHPGHMSQFGLNTGARHANVLGQAKSITKDLDRDTRIDHDMDVIGAVSITWSLICSVMPTEILSEVDDALEADGMPRLASRDVAENHGFHIKSNGTTYLFPTAERAPPEAYLAVGYQAWTHVDPAYCTWAFASCVARDVPGSTVEGGENFVDASLRVVVHQAARTLIAFRPAHLHGTTRTCGATNTMISISFSKRVADAWAKASSLERAQVVAGSGAGPTNETKTVR